MSSALAAYHRGGYPGVLDPNQIREVRNVWQFYRDRRPDSYGDLVAP